VTQPTVDCVMDHSTVDVDPAVQPLRCATALVMASEPSSLSAVNLKVALDHAALGTPVFPVSVVQGPDGRWKKRPAFKGWKDAATTDPDQIRKWWREFPEAVPGIQLGPAGLIVIDADRHDLKQDGVEAFAGLRAEHQEIPHPQTLTAGGGEHHFYRQPAARAFGNGEGNLPDGINVRGSGGFVVAPGAVRPDGAIWEPAPGAPELTMAFRAGAVPELPSWLGEILAPGRHQANSANPRLGPADTSVKNREQAYALAALDSCVVELEQTPPGKRNNRLNAIAYRLGRMIVRGWVDRQIVVRSRRASAIAFPLTMAKTQFAIRLNPASRPGLRIPTTIYRKPSPGLKPTNKNRLPRSFRSFGMGTLHQTRRNGWSAI
jgi:Bifunctional DNA primase/polymerase, N-terminal